VIALLGVLDSPRAVAQQTEAERDSLALRPLTKEEFDALFASCKLPQPTRNIEINGTSYAYIQLPAMQFIELARLERGYTRGDQSNIDLLPDLPFGGIGGAHLCREALFVALDGPARADVSYAIRLRPGLDVRKSYPSSYDQILENDQLKASESRAYMMISLDESDPIDALELVFGRLDALSGASGIDWTGTGIMIRSHLLLPVN